MKQYAKWIGGAIGWGLGGPLGGFIGFILGSTISSLDKEDFSTKTSNNQTLTGDFELSLLALSAFVIKADGRTDPRELEFVRQKFISIYGEQRAKNVFTIFKKLVQEGHFQKKEDIARYIGQKMDKGTKLQLVHFLFSIGIADGELSDLELAEKKLLSGNLGLDFREFDSIHQIFIGKTPKDDSWAYKVLEIDKNASLTEIKSAYRILVKKYHPDIVAHLGTEYTKVAEEKFKKIQEAYEFLISK